MSIQGIFRIEENKSIARNTYLLRLCGDTSEIRRPGQFVNIKLEGRYLRRPLSVCDWAEGSLTLIYKVVGDGTEQLSGLAAGSCLDLLTGLGNGYDIEDAGEHCVLVGGGVGVPPLYALAKHLLERAVRPRVVLGFNTAAECFFEEEFRALGLEVNITTVDGSAGMRGMVTDALKTLSYDEYFACGPLPMLRAVHALGKSGQLSFEERMGCGFGACMGCSCKTLAGNKRICMEGPVLRSAEVMFDTNPP